MKSFRRELKLAMQAGDYRAKLLHDWRHLYSISKQPIDYINLVSCQRAMGIPPHPRQQNKLIQLRQLPTLYRMCLGIYGFPLRQLDNLISFHDEQAEPAVQDQYKRPVKQWRQNQKRWLKQFKAQIQAAKSIAIVGNSASLKGQSYGPEIDQADLVLRFNRYHSEQTTTNDIGSKLDVWVVAPGYQGPTPLTFSHVLLSGPDMLWWQQNWAHLGEVMLENKSERTVISTPLEVWRSLVQVLAAPPSAGILTIELIRQWLSEDELKKVKIYGFGHNPNSKDAYHHADPNHRAVTRHNWAAEETYLNQVNLQYAQKHDSH